MIDITKKYCNSFVVWDPTDEVIFDKEGKGSWTLINYSSINPRIGLLYNGSKKHRPTILQLVPPTFTAKEIYSAWNQIEDLEKAGRLTYERLMDTLEFNLLIPATERGGKGSKNNKKKS